MNLIVLSQTKTKAIIPFEEFPFDKVNKNSLFLIDKFYCVEQNKFVASAVSYVSMNLYCAFCEEKKAKFRTHIAFSSSPPTYILVLVDRINKYEISPLFERYLLNELMCSLRVSGKENKTKEFSFCFDCRERVENEILLYLL